MLLFFVRPNELRLENEVPTLSWKLYMNLLQPKLKVIIFVFFLSIFVVIYGWFTTRLPPFFNPLHTPKKDKTKVESQIIIHA